MLKHDYNIFPEMNNKDKSRLYNDIKEHGYDEGQPIVLCQNKILDGWNRYQVCKDLNITPTYKDFTGDNAEAINFVMRTNKRRNLSSSQWAAIACEAEDIIQTIKDSVEKIRREKQAEAIKNTPRDNEGHFTPVCGHKCPETGNDDLPNTEQKEPTETASKVANLFNTSKTYIKEATKIKKEQPEVFEKIKSGEMTITQAKKIGQIEKRKQEIEDNLKNNIEKKPIVYNEDAFGFLSRIDKVDLLLTDPPYSTDIADINAFANHWLPLALSKVKDTGFAFVFIGAYPKEIQAYLNIALPTQILIWEYKNTLGNNPKDRYKQNYQAILYYKMSKAPDLNIAITNEQWAVQSINAPDGRLGDRYHSWQKPIELAERFISHTTKPGYLIADPFCCTGTFLLAGSLMGRSAIGCDISEENLKIAIQRGCEYGG